MPVAVHCVYLEEEGRWCTCSQIIQQDSYMLTEQYIMHKQEKGHWVDSVANFCIVALLPRYEHSHNFFFLLLEFIEVNCSSKK